MKRAIKRFLSYVLCMCLCITVLPVHAEGESDTTESTFTVTLDKSTIYESNVDQTVVMTVNADQPIALAAIGAKVYCADALSLTAITNNDTRIDFTGNVNIDNGRIDWYDSNQAVYSNVTNIAVATFTVPAGTSAGEYTIGLSELILLDGNGEPFVNGITVSASLKVEAADEVTGYATGISASEKVLEVDDTVNINITVSHSSEEAFAAAEINVEYDSSVLTFDADTFHASYPSVSADTATSNTLKLVDHGESKSFGENDYVYILPFKAVAAADNTNVTLSYAGFATQTEAETKDLAEAACNPENVTLNISEKSLTVTLPEGDILTGDISVAYGDDYTFTLADKDNYTYEITSVMMGNTEVLASLVDNGDGTYTVPDVTGALVITATRSAKQYSVTLDATGSGNEDINDDLVTGEKAATYEEDFSFSITPEENFAYIVTYTIGENTVELTVGENNTYTIPGTAITGDITIKVDKDSTIANVSVEGNGADAAGEYATTATKGQTYTLTVNPEAGYVADSYVVTATMENEEGIAVAINLTVENNTYTTPEVTGKLVFTITATVDTSGISVSEYIQLDGTVMWLVTNTTAVAEGKVPAYNNENMLWSEKYNNGAGAYCYLAVADTLTVEEAKGKLDIGSGIMSTVDYGMDVNKTDKVDASDAQLVYNIYNTNTTYTGFTEDVTVEKYLRADVNGDAMINVNDARAIIEAILGTTATN